MKENTYIKVNSFQTEEGEPAVVIDKKVIRIFKDTELDMAGGLPVYIDHNRYYANRPVFRDSVHKDLWIVKVFDLYI